MNTPCPFSKANLSFNGTPVEQARCLLRKIRIGGDVDDQSAVLPAFLESLIGNPVNFTKNQLFDYLETHQIDQEKIGGSLSEPLCQTSSGKTAAYFIVHDTSTELDADAFPASINTAAWSGNRIEGRTDARVHIFINRLGDSATTNKYSRKTKAATKFELNSHHGPEILGLFLHHELIQPRIRGKYSYHALAPDPGFPSDTYQRLAVCYLAASVRKGQFLIPALHAAIDTSIPDAHDDPQKFDLAAWSEALATITEQVQGASSFAAEKLLTSDALKGDPVLEAVAHSHSKLGPSETRSPAVARVQKALNKLSGSTPAYAIDLGRDDQFAGYYGSKTARAVDAFQRNHGFAGSGEIGSATILALDAASLALENPAQAPRPPAPAPAAEHGNPVGAPSPFHLSPGYAHDKEDPAKGWARTTGLKGATQGYSDNSSIMTCEETLTAKRRTKTYGPITAKQTRIIRGNEQQITQSGYCYDGRQLPGAVFLKNHPGLTGEGVIRGYSTRFGKSDDADEGTGSEAFGIVQTASEVCGCSVKKSILTSWFGPGYASDPARLTALVEIYFTRNGRYARVPLVDIGPGENVSAKIDLTWAVDQFLGTDGGDLDYDVLFRLSPG
jgi:hypothetical protein